MSKKIIAKIELTQDQKQDFFKFHLPHRLTLLLCLKERKQEFIDPKKANGDIYRCVKDSSLIAIRLFMDFLGLRGDFNGTSYILNENPRKKENDIKLDQFVDELVKPSNVSPNMKELLAAVYVRADKELAHLTYIFNEEYNQENVLIEAACAVEELIKQFLYAPLNEPWPFNSPTKV